MVGLDRAGKAIALSNGNQLNYDFLIITCGLQEPSATVFAQVGELLAAYRHIVRVAWVELSFFACYVSKMRPAVVFSSLSRLFMFAHIHTDKHTKHTLNTQRDPEVAGAVCGSQELTADFTFGDAMTMDKIIVYGAGMDAYQALSVLEIRGEHYTQTDLCDHTHL